MVHGRRVLHIPCAPMSAIRRARHWDRAPRRGEMPGSDPYTGRVAEAGSATTVGTESGGATPRSSHPDLALALGQRLGDRYTILAYLGHGGMGAVYRAHDDVLDVDVAIKLVHERDGLRDEVRLAQNVTHPSVCRIHDLEDIGGLHVLKMEYLAGETLSARIRRDGALPVAEAVRIARAIGDGLAAIHAQGIVHRDLKPANVMLAGDRVVLMDFGL